MGGLLSVPFTLTLSPGQLSNLRNHRGLIEGWHLESCAEIPGGRHPCREHQPTWPRIRLSSLTGSHSCPVPVPGPICLCAGWASSSQQGPVCPCREELAAMPASLAPCPAWSTHGGQCHPPLALFPSAGRALQGWCLLSLLSQLSSLSVLVRTNEHKFSDLEQQRLSGSPKSRCHWGCGPPEALGSMCPRPLPLLGVAGNPRHSVACRRVTPVCFCCHMTLSLCVCVPLCLLHRVPVIGFRALRRMCCAVCPLRVCTCCW